MKFILFYFVTIVAGVGIFLGINHYGLGLFGAESLGIATQGPVHMTSLGEVLLGLVTVIISARACGLLFKKIGQPTVMGEVVGGIILGPSFLGRLVPGLMDALIPPSTLPYLNIIAQIGIVIYMFLVGLELDLKVLKKSAHTSFIISHASILFPFLLGSILALGIFQELAPPGVSFTNFALFLGVSMSITAFPVLARILSDRNMTKTKIGSLALTCAAIDDVTAWCLLALVVSRVQSTMSSALITFVLSVTFILGMIFLIKPFLEKWVLSISDTRQFAPGKVAFFLIGILVSALITEAIGIHAIFGAFVFGVIVPHDSFVSRNLDYKLQEVVRVLFLPAFFAYTGMKTQIGLMGSLHDLILCLLIVAVAIVGKLGGTVISAKILKNSWRDSLILGVLMNTRGLVELIALNIGLELGILSPRLFTMLVIMAVVTTFITGPALGFLKMKTAES